MKFPKDAPKQKVIKTLESLGFTIVRIGTHISMIRENPEGTKIPLTMPNHDTTLTSKRLNIEGYLQTIWNKKK